MLYPNAGPNVEGQAPSAASQATAPSTGAGGIIERIKNILMSPRIEWGVIAPESVPAGQVITGYVLPLAALSVLISFVRMSIIGISVPFAGTLRTPMTTGLTYAVMGLVAGVLGVCVVGVIINALAPTFGGTRDQRQAVKTAAYALTPAWISAVFSLLPAMGTLLQFMAGLYGIYVLYLGLPVMMRSRRESAAGYTALVVVCTILLGVFFGVLSTGLGIGRAAGLSAFSAASRTDSAEARREAAAASAANILGGVLGTDAQGKAGLANALSNMATVGEQAAATERAAAQSAPASATQVNASGANPSSGDTAGTNAGAASDTAANPLGAAGGLLNALGGALGGGRRVEPVDFHTLEALLPASLPGMKRENLQGNGKQALGVKGTTATASYRGVGDARIDIELADASGVSGLMGLAESLGVNDTSESSTGYEKQAVIAGRSVHEKYVRNSKHGEVSTIIAKRFTVEVSGDSVDMPVLEKTLSELDLSALEAMKDSGAH